MEAMATDHAVMIHSMHHVEHVLQACTCCWVYLATSCQRLSKICTKGCATLAIWTSWTMMCSFLVTVGWDQLYYYDPTGNANTNTRVSTSTSTSTTQRHYYYYYHHHRHEWKPSISHARRAYLFMLEIFLCYVMLAVGLGVLYLFRRLFESKRQRGGGRQQLSPPQLEALYDDNHDDGEYAYCYHEQQEEGRVVFLEEQEPDSSLAVRPRSFSLVLLCQEMGGELVVFVDHSQWIRKRLTKRLVLALMLFGLYYRLLLLVLDRIVNLSSSSTSHDSNERGGKNNENGNENDDSHNGSKSSSSSSSPSCWDDDAIVLISLLGVYPVLFLMGAWGIQLVWTKSRQRPPTTTTTTSFSYEDNGNNHEGEYNYYLDDGDDIGQMLWDREQFDNDISNGSHIDSRMSLL